MLSVELYLHLECSPSGLSLGQMSPMPTLFSRLMAIRHYKKLNHHFNVFVIIHIHFVDVDFVYRCLEFGSEMNLVGIAKFHFHL